MESIAGLSVYIKTFSQHHLWKQVNLFVFVTGLILSIFFKVTYIFLNYATY